LRLSLLYPSHHPNARLCDLEHTASGFWIVDLRRHRTCSSCPYMLFTSPASFEKAGHDWGRVATLPAAGTGPFRLTKVLPREMADLARFDGYWDQGHKAKLDTCSRSRRRTAGLPRPARRPHQVREAHRM
jgi:hypothetical protein